MLSRSHAVPVFADVHLPMLKRTSSALNGTSRRATRELLAFLSMTTTLAGLFFHDALAEPMMYWVDYTQDRIERSLFDGTSRETVLSAPPGMEFSSGIALDLCADKLYWTAGPSGDAQTMYRANIDGSGIEPIIPDAGHGLWDVEVAGDKVYWSSDTSAYLIQRANLDGTGAEVILADPHGNFDIPTALAIDLEQQKIYWTERGGVSEVNGRILRADLNGSNIEVLLTTQEWVDRPQGIALDHLRGKFYWVNRLAGAVWRANLDGSNPQRPWLGNEALAISIDEAAAYMYFTGINKTGDYGIYRATLDGSNETRLVPLTAGVNDVKDLELCCFETYAATESPSSTALICPAGNAPTLEEQGAGVIVRIMDGNCPVAGIPPADIWIDDVGTGDINLCADGTIADRPTTPQGVTSITHALRAGGFTQSGMQVYLAGEPLSLPPLDMSLNSPDNNGDLVVNIVDLGTFAIDLNQGHHFRSDFNFDGVINLADVGVFAMHNGDSCP